MKKVILVFISCLLLVGCGKKEIVKISYDKNYYDIVTPYKEAVGSYTLNSYDKSEVESMLMYVSTKYFSPNNSLYQEGQYLDNDIIKELLDKLNETDNVLSDNITKPTYISTIYEQDYLANNGNLKGISLAIVLDATQEYKVDGINKKDIMKEEDVLKFGIDASQKLLDKVRSIEELKDVKIVIGLYLESDNYVKGSFKYIGDTSNKKIKLDYINYNYQLLDSNNLASFDLEDYSNFEAIKTTLKDYNVYVKGVGLYKDSNLLKVDITISKNYLKDSEILNISDLISNQLINFSDNVEVKVYFKSNNEMRAFLIKEDNNAKIIMMED